MLRLLVVDSQGGLRARLHGAGSRGSSRAQAEVAVVAAADEAQALERLHSAGQEPVDAVLVRTGAQEGLGPGLVRRLRTTAPGLAVLMVLPPDAAASEPQPAVLGEVFDAGAAGLVTEDCGTQEMVACARRAVRGERVLSSRAAEVLITVVEQMGRAHQREREPVGTEVSAEWGAETSTEVSTESSAETSSVSSLPPRLWDIWCHLARGESNRCIARDLGLSENTVRIYVSEVLHRLGYTARTELIAASAGP